MEIERPFGRKIPKLEVNNITPNIKQWFAQELIKDQSKIDSFSSITGLDKKLLSKWKNKLLRGEVFLKNGGSVPLVNKSEVTEIIKLTGVAVKSQAGYKPGDAKTLWSDGVRKSQNVIGRHHDGKISDRTIRNYYKMEKFSIKNGSMRPDARLESEFDLRNALSQIIMWDSMFQYVTRLCCFGNYDATQFEFGPGDRKQKVVVPPGFKREKCRPVSTTSTAKDKDMNYYIKYYCVVNAAGYLSPKWVFVIADSSMDKDDCKWYAVRGLSQNEEEVGYICFCQTRCCNAKFYRWFNSHILVEFIQQIKANEDLPLGAPFFMHCDGEHTQIDVYMTEECSKEFSDVHAMIGKVCASSTAVSQALDAYILFKGTKSALRGLQPEDYMYQEGLLGRINAVVDLHSKDFNSADKRRLGPGLLAIRIAIINTMKPKHIVECFTQIGVNKDCSLNIDQVLRQFSCTLSHSEFANLMMLLPACRKKFLKDGGLPDAVLNEFDCVKRRGYNGKDKDTLTLCRMRCKIVNHLGTLSQYEGRKEEKRVAALRVEQEKLDRVEQKIVKAREKEEAVRTKRLLAEEKAKFLASERERKLKAKEDAVVERKRKADEKVAASELAKAAKQAKKVVVG